MAKGRKTGGRTKGTPNKVTAELKGMAQAYTVDAIATLVAIMTNPDAHATARTIAAREILDRGHGKPTFAVEHTGEVALPVTIHHHFSA